MNTLVVGLGNPILTDDGVGVKVAYEIEAALSPDLQKEVTVTEASVGGLRLMELMINYDRVIIIDAFLTQDGSNPGAIKKLSLEDLNTVSPTQHSASAHDTNLNTALKMGRRMDLPLPEEVIIFAVEVENVMDFSDQPTPAVAEAIPRVIDAVLAELNRRP